MDDLLPFILLSAGGNAGTGGNFMNNPFLFYVLLKNDTKLKDDNTLLLLMATMFSGNQIAGGNGANLMSSPLLPLLLFSGGLGAGGNNAVAANPLFLSLLLKDDNSTLLNSTSDLLPLLLISSMGAQGADISSALPLLLLKDDFKLGDNNNILLILALSGALGGINTGLTAGTRQGEVNNLFGGLANGNMPSLLPLILIGEDKFDTKDLLLFSLFLKILMEWEVKDYREFYLFCLLVTLHL